jgi:hypothetical protein
MTEPSFAPLIRPVQEYVIPLLDDALSAAAERHQLTIDRGSDNLSFGTDAWSLPTRLLRNAIEDQVIPFTMENIPACILGYGEFRLHHHRVGANENDDVRALTPARAESAAKAAEQQMSFAFLPEEETPPQFKTVVLAFTANYNDGLCAAYLATIGRVEDGKIAEWGEIERIWSRSGGDVVEPVEVVSSPFAPPPAERSRRPVVTLNRPQVSDAEEA